MANIDALLAKASELGSLLARVAHGGKRILVVTHIDADGLSSGAIVFRALARKGAIVSVRAIPDLDPAVAQGSIAVSNDFLFYGRETRPVHEAIGMTYSPMIPGLSGSKDAALAALSNSGFRIKTGGRWRTIAELSMEEKKLLLDVLTSFLVSSSTG